MIRNAKAFGFALVAVAAIGMVAVSGAQAAQLHAAASPNVSITGEQIQSHRFKFAGSGMEAICTQALFEGTTQGGSGGQTTFQELTLTPTYAGCKTAGLNSQILANGCKYTLTGSGQPANTFAVDLTGCTSGKVMEIKLTGCTVTILPNTGTSHEAIHTTSGHVEVTITVQGETYEFHGVACPGPHPGPTELTHDGESTGTSTIRTFVDNGSEVASHNGHSYNKIKCGAQVSLVST